jgi:predicted DNA-binding transcriptional regulator AlpA
MGTVTGTAHTRAEMVDGGMMTVEEGRQFLRVSRSTIYDLMDSG